MDKLDIDSLRRLYSLFVASIRKRRLRGAKLTRRQSSLVAAILIVLLGGAGVTVGQLLRKFKHVPVEKPGMYRTSSSVLLKDGWSREIHVPHKDGESRVVIKPTKKITFEAHKRLFTGEDGKDLNKEKLPVGINSRLLRELSAIWVIIVPRMRSKASLLLLTHAAFLGLRTWLSLIVAKLDGRIVRDIIGGNGQEFIRGLIYWFMLAVPASYSNATIRYLQAKISLEFRTKLIRYIHDIYLNSTLNYYKANNIDGSIEGIDQYITSDVTKFCDAAASLYSTIGKPAADFVIFSYQLSHNLGSTALVGIFANYFSTAYLLKRIAPPFGKLTSMEAKLEGEYRNAHTRLITNAEEISFYDGTDLERSVMTDIFAKLVKHSGKVLRVKVSYNIFEDFILKYGWSALGYIFASVPVFLPNLVNVVNTANGASERDRVKQFITNRRLMLSLADAGGHLMYSIKDLAELSGYASRVYQLLETLHRVYSNSYPPSDQDFTIGNTQGTFQLGFEGVRFEHVPVVIPAANSSQSGEVLIDDLSFVILPGDHILISGANGVGKTSIIRILAKLWPLYKGLVSCPNDRDITFLPQRPYFSSGTLRDQFIYPSSYSDMVDSERTDEDLLEILKMVHLDYIVAREGNWETIKPWKDVFSGGEKQRAMFARVLYHHPKFAVIDEGTSAVSADIEGTLYEVCKKHEITLITISHRTSLMKYHNIQLSLELNKWNIRKKNSGEAKRGVEKEVADLKQKLAQVDQWKERHAQIIKELSEISGV